MHVHANAAMSVDGKLSTRRREPVPISGPEDFARVDRLRAESDAVMVGVGTVIADDPSLTVDHADLVAQRKDRGDPAQPSRVVADSRARIGSKATILDPTAPTYVLVSSAAPERRVAELEAEGTAVITAGEERVDLTAALDSLDAEGVDRLMVEGGGELLFSLFAADLIDVLTVYVGPVVIGGRDAPTLADGDGFVDGFRSLSFDGSDRLDDGILLRYTRPED